MKSRRSFCIIRSLAVALGAFSMCCHAQSRESTEGIGFEEHLRTFPPAPVAVRAELGDDLVVVLWKKPKPVDRLPRPAYDPVIGRYRVYRLGPDRQDT